MGWCAQPLYILESHIETMVFELGNKGKLPPNWRPKIAQKTPSRQSGRGFINRYGSVNRRFTIWICFVYGI